MSDKIVIMDFYAEWCAPCKALAVELEKVVEDNDDVEVLKINIEDDMEFTKSHGVRSLPTIIIQNGADTVEHVGFIRQADIEKLLEQVR